MIQPSNFQPVTFPSDPFFGFGTEFPFFNPQTTVFPNFNPQTTGFPNFGQETTPFDFFTPTEPIIFENLDDVFNGINENFITPNLTPTPNLSPTENLLPTQNLRPTKSSVPKFFTPITTRTPLFGLSSIQNTFLPSTSRFSSLTPLPTSTTSTTSKNINETKIEVISKVSFGMTI